MDAKHSHRAAWSALLHRKLDERGMSQYRLAAILGVSRPTVSAWCTATNVPSPEWQARLIEELDISGDELLALHREPAA